MFHMQDFVSIETNFSKEKKQLLSLLNFQEILTLVNDLIPSQTNHILVTTSYIYKREVLLKYFDSI